MSVSFYSSFVSDCNPKKKNEYLFLDLILYCLVYRHIGGTVPSNTKDLERAILFTKTHNLS